jgi:hypothetical protein
VIIKENLKIDLPYDPPISALVTYWKVWKWQSWRDICTPMFIALFPIALSWSVGDWVKKMYTIGYYSAIQNGILAGHGGICL